MLEARKTKALEEYKKARENHMKNATNENWIAFCNAKRNCMLLGVRV